MKIMMSNYSVVPLLCLLATPLWAEPIPEWVGSYSAAGQCYCAPGMSTALRDKIMPTPIGGQSIGQICERIGEGPALALDDSGFNHPAYHDAQCGNGPFTIDSDGCDGRLANNDSICSGAGPAWDLKAVYSKPVVEQASTQKNTQAERVTTEPAPAVKKAADVKETELTAQKRAEADARAAKVAAATLAAARAKAEADNAAAARLEAAKIAASKRAVEQNQAARDQKAGDQARDQARDQAQKLEQARAESADTDADSIVAARRAAAQAALDRRRTERAPAQTPDTDVAKLEAAKVEAAKAEAAKVEAARLAAAKATQDEAALEAEKAAARVEAERRQAELALATAPAVEQKAKIPEPQLQPDVASTDAEKQEITDSMAESTAGKAADTTASPAVRLPKKLTAVDPSSGYIQIAPISFDFGGAGPSLEGVLGFASAWQFKGRAAVVEEYSELMVGISRLFKPDMLRGGMISLLAGWEYGNFDLGITELTDSGAMLDSSLGFVVTPRVSLAAGMSYSSFFEGDPSIYGQLLFRIVNNLDFSTRVEGGDNDNFALGLRYNY